MRDRTCAELLARFKGTTFTRERSRASALLRKPRICALSPRRRGMINELDPSGIFAGRFRWSIYMHGGCRQNFGTICRYPMGLRGNATPRQPSSMFSCISSFPLISRISIVWLFFHIHTRSPWRAADFTLNCTEDNFKSFQKSSASYAH